MNRGVRFVVLGALAAFVCVAAPPEEKPLAPWAYAGVWPRHSQLRAAMIAAMNRGDVKTWIEVARAGIRTVPGDPTWHYNLACALSIHEDVGLALTELEKAVTFGFRDVDAIEKDTDLDNVRKQKRYKEIVAKARKLGDFPVAGRPVPGPAVAPVGGTVKLTGTNVVWDFEVGAYRALVKFVEPAGGAAVSPLARSYAGPGRELLAAWLSEGTAAGNGFDLYVNRDRAHSPLRTGDFPLLARVAWGADAVAAGVDTDLPTMLFPEGVAVLGNASRAWLAPVIWRSLPRQALTNSDAARRLALLYFSNQLWFFPAVKDVSPNAFGDVFSAVAPWFVISVGASYTDQPFLRAAAAASAAFPRPTKAAILKRGLFGPTLQWLLRRSLKTVRDDADYLTARAHPTAFPAGSVDETALVTRAHALHPEDVPSVAALALVNSRLFPIVFPQPGVDYPDACGEVTFATPSAIGIVLRGTGGERTFLFQARAVGGGEKDEQDASENDADKPEFCWRVVHGDPARVTIERPLGETVNGPEQGLAQIKIDRRGMTNRIDVACFVRVGKTAWGAPSFISFAVVPSEERVYDKDGRIVSIDYAARPGVYADPSLVLPRNWKDVYDYAPDGRLRGFTRWTNGKVAGEFTAQGAHVVSRLADGTPSKIVDVRYVPRSQGGGKPNELTWVDVAE